MIHLRIEHLNNRNGTLLVLVHGQLLTRCRLGQRAFRQTYLTYGLRISIVGSLHLQTNAVGHLALVLQRPVHIELADAPCILPFPSFKNRYTQFGIHHVIRVQI